jgi:hypothetical protein
VTSLIEVTVLKSMGLDDNDIDAINARIPDVMNLITVIQTHQAQFNRVMALLPIVQKALAHERTT